jgi:hypothetical protein
VLVIRRELAFVGDRPLIPLIECAAGWLAGALIFLRRLVLGLDLVVVLRNRGLD